MKIIPGVLFALSEDSQWHIYDPGSCQGSGKAATAWINCTCVGIVLTAFHENELNFTLHCTQSIILHMPFYLWDRRGLENT